jgi:hypothetical protein
LIVFEFYIIFFHLDHQNFCPHYYFLQNFWRNRSFLHQNFEMNPSFYLLQNFEKNFLRTLHHYSM